MPLLQNFAKEASGQPVSEIFKKTLEAASKVSSQKAFELLKENLSPLLERLPIGENTLDLDYKGTLNNNLSDQLTTNLLEKFQVVFNELTKYFENKIILSEKIINKIDFHQFIDNFENELDKNCQYREIFYFKFYLEKFKLSFYEIFNKNIVSLENLLPSLDYIYSIIIELHIYGKKIDEQLEENNNFIYYIQNIEKLIINKSGLIDLIFRNINHKEIDYFKKKVRNFGKKINQLSEKKQKLRKIEQHIKKKLIKNEKLKETADDLGIQNKPFEDDKNHICNKDLKSNLKMEDYEDHKIEKLNKEIDKIDNKLELKIKKCELLEENNREIIFYILKKNIEIERTEELFEENRAKKINLDRKIFSLGAIPDKEIQPKLLNYEPSSVEKLEHLKNEIEELQEYIKSISEKKLELKEINAEIKSLEKETEYDSQDKKDIKNEKVLISVLIEDKNKELINFKKIKKEMKEEFIKKEKILKNKTEEYIKIKKRVYGEEELLDQLSLGVEQEKSLKQKTDYLDKKIKEIDEKKLNMEEDKIKLDKELEEKEEELNKLKRINSNLEVICYNYNIVLSIILDKKENILEDNSSIYDIPLNCRLTLIHKNIDLEKKYFDLLIEKHTEYLLSQMISLNSRLNCQLKIIESSDSLQEKLSNTNKPPQKQLIDMDNLIKNKIQQHNSLILNLILKYRDLIKNEPTNRKNIMIFVMINILKKISNKIKRLVPQKSTHQDMTNFIGYIINYQKVINSKEHSLLIYGALLVTQHAIEQETLLFTSQLWLTVSDLIRRYQSVYQLEEQKHKAITGLHSFWRNDQSNKHLQWNAMNAIESLSKQVPAAS